MVGELYVAGVCGVVDQVLGLKMGSSLCCESCLRALCSLLCAKVRILHCGNRPLLALRVRTVLN